MLAIAIPAGLLIGLSLGALGGGAPPPRWRGRWPATGWPPGWTRPG